MMRWVQQQESRRSAFRTGEGRGRWTADVGRVCTVCDVYGRKDRSNGEKEGQVSARRPTHTEWPRTAGDGGGGGEDVRTGKGGKVVQENKEKRCSSAAGALADRLLVRTLGQNAVDVDGGEAGFEDNEEVTGPFLTFLTDARPVGRGLSQSTSVPSAGAAGADREGVRVTAGTGHGETQGGRGWINARGAAGASGG